MTSGSSNGVARSQILRLLLLGLLLLGLLPGGEADADSTSDATPQLESGWRLAGIVVSPGLSEALFVLDSTTRELREGDELDGWTLAAIRASAVTLRRGEAEKTLSLEAQPVEASAAAPAAAPIAEAAPPLQSAQAVRAAARAQQKQQTAAESQLAKATKEMMMTHRDVRGEPPAQ
jgi:hypothetical protein